MLSGTVVGNLGGDATTKTVGDSTVVEFSIATSVKKGGEERTTWVRCAYWGKPAEAVAQYLVKGKTVACSGDLELREYERKEGGKGASLEMRVNRLQLLGGGAEAAKPAGGARQNGRATSADDAENW